MRVAITREVSASIAHCELTHVERQPIDVERARVQHAAYEATLQRLGCRLVRLPATPDLPDAVFVEDAAIVLDEVAVITRPGAPSRQPETRSVAAALKPYRTLLELDAPAHLDGGDVLVVGRTIFVGVSGRTNPEGVVQLRHALAPLKYEVLPIEVDGCLHLKSAVTLVAPGLLLINPEWLPDGVFPELDCLTVDPAEPFGANALRVGEQLVYPAEHPRTLERLVARGLAVTTVPASELAKAEGGVTCCSLVFNA